MQLTQPHRAIVREAAMADPTASGYIATGDTYSLLGWLNAPKTPTVLAWRTDAPSRLIEEAATYTGYDSMTQGKRDSWRLFLSNPRDFTSQRVRVWATDVWGKATASSIGAAVLLAGTEPVTNAQAAIGGTTQATDSVSAMVRAFAGHVDMEDANAIASGYAGPASVRG